jgi:hypothetical protein
MPKTSLPLTDFKIRSLKTRDKPYKVSDGHGLYIFVSKTGEKIWRFDYKYETHKTLTIGFYPNVGIQEARNCLQIAKNDLKNGLDPMAKKKAIKTVEASAFTQDSFESIAREFIELHKSSLAPKQHERNIQMAETRLFPILGVRPIKTIKTIDILTILRDVENQGYFSTKKVGKINLFLVDGGLELEGNCRHSFF